MAVAGGVLLLLVLPLAAVIWRAEGAGGLTPADWGAIRFTILQAALSAIFSITLAVPVARALARRDFRGRGVLVTLLGAPFLLPVIVAVLGLLAVFGRQGWINTVIQSFGFGTFEIYGLGGVVLAHVFLNMPLAIRLLLQSWQRIPAERFRLAGSLGFGPRDMRRHFERPILWSVVPGAAALIFLICCSSFAVALILGGGPRATTIELAIYQAFRFEFDLSRAAILGLVQLGLCVGIGLLAMPLTGRVSFGRGFDRAPVAWPGLCLWHMAWDGACITLAMAFLIAPLMAVVLDGVPAFVGLPPQVWAAAGRSVILAFVSTILALACALPLAALIARRGRAAWIEGIGLISLALSPLVIGTGAFILVFPIANPTALALPITALVNALISLPFMLRALVPAYVQIEQTQGRLCDALGLPPRIRFWRVIMPRLRAPLGFGAGVSAAFSMGDLGVIALFSAPNHGTLPLEMYRLMGSYRTDDAQGAALLLVILTLGLFWICDRGGRLHVTT